MTQNSERLLQTVTSYFRKPVGSVDVYQVLWGIHVLIPLDDRVEFARAVYEAFTRFEEWHSEAKQLFRGLSCIDKSENVVRRQDFKDKFDPEHSLAAMEKRRRLKLNAREVLESQQRKREAPKRLMREQKEREDKMRLQRIKEQGEIRHKAYLELYNSPEERAKRKKEALRRDMSALIESLCFAARQSDSLVGVDPPLESDINLAEQWAHDEKDSTLSMMLSARLAEIAVHNYYSSKGYQVDDIALTQLEGEGGDWKLYDLRIKKDGMDFLLDVKNARRSAENEQSYTSHIVPKFKEKKQRDDSVYKTSSKPVHIAGVLSHYQKNPDVIMRAPRDVQFLGLTKYATLKEITKEFTNDWLTVNFSSPWIDEDRRRKTLLPPWVFEYSSESYETRDDLLSKLDIDRFSELSGDIGYRTLGLVLCRSSKLERMPSCNRNFIESLERRISIHNLSLPILYCTILEHFVSCLKDTNERQFDSDFIHTLIYPNQGDERTTPLFIYDPCCSIFGLIHSLGILWEHRNERIREMHEFRLQNFNILKGKLSNRLEGPKEYTLLAYCGGYHENPKRPCGKTPLIIGECETCDLGFLKCPVCGYCCEIHKPYRDEDADSSEGDETQNIPDIQPKGNAAEDIPF